MAKTRKYRVTGYVPGKFGLNKFFDNVVEAANSQIAEALGRPKWGKNVKVKRIK